MHYGIVTQSVGAHKEYQLRAYPLKSQRTQDGATALTVKQAYPMRQRLRAAFQGVGGIRTIYITAAEAQELQAC